MNPLPMVRRLMALCPLCWLALSPSATWAQAPHRPEAGHVQDASAAVPPLRYSSVLQHYRPLPEIQQPASWVQSNERVGRIGGWRSYAREMQQADAPAASSPANSMHDSHKARPAEAVGGKPSHGHHHHGGAAQHGGHKP